MKELFQKCKCDRCGKEVTCHINTKRFTVVGFHEEYKPTISGDVCQECLKDFYEFTKNFFDEVNRDEQREADL